MHICINVDALLWNSNIILILKAGWIALSLVNSISPNIFVFNLHLARTWIIVSILLHFWICIHNVFAFLHMHWSFNQANDRIHACSILSLCKIDKTEKAIIQKHIKFILVYWHRLTWCFQGDCRTICIQVRFLLSVQICCNNNNNSLMDSETFTIGF